MHPWSPIGTIVLLPFKPILKRTTSLVLFTLLLTPTVLHSYNRFEHERARELSAQEQELLAMASWLNQGHLGKSMWVLGTSPRALYAMTDLKGSALLPPFLSEQSDPFLPLRMYIYYSMSKRFKS